MNKIRINGLNHEYTELKFNPVMSYLSLKLEVKGYYKPENNNMIIEYHNSVYSGIKELYHYDDKQDLTRFLIYIEESKEK